MNNMTHFVDARELELHDLENIAGGIAFVPALIVGAKVAGGVAAGGAVLYGGFKLGDYLAYKHG